MSFCISPAYGFLLPAYGALWLAGRWYAKTSNKQVRHRFAFSTLLPLAAWVVIGGVVSELFSSGGFYFFSGRFEPNLAEFGARIARYFPSSLAMLAFYAGIAAIVHAALDAVRHVVVTGRGAPPWVPPPLTAPGRGTPPRGSCGYRQ